MSAHHLLSRSHIQPIILDGATGSILRQYGMPRDAATELWAEAHPQTLLTLQEAYVAAGSQIIYAPTFRATPQALSAYGRAKDTEKLCAALVALSKSTAGGQALVAGDITTMAGDLDVWDSANHPGMLEGYRRQIRGIVDGGADMLVAETLLYPHEAEMIWEAAALEHVELPMLYSFTMDSSGALFSGRDAGPVLRELEEAGAAAVGFNCVAAGDQLGALVSRLRRYVRGPLISKPNAGNPVIRTDGQVDYPMEPGEFARHQKEAAALGAGLLGGCCGTGPEYIRQLTLILRSPGASSQP